MVILNVTTYDASSECQVRIWIVLGSYSNTRYIVLHLTLLFDRGQGFIEVRTLPHEVESLYEDRSPEQIFFSADSVMAFHELIWDTFVEQTQPLTTQSSVIL